MKRFLFFALLAGIALTSCKKDSDSAPSYNGQFTLNSTTYNFSDMEWSENGVSAIYYRVESFDDVSNEIVIQIPTKTVGDYTFNDPKNGGSNVNIELTIGTNIYSSVHGNGKVTITKSDASIVEGTFSGKFTNKTLTVDASGSFTAKKFSLSL